MSVGGEITMTIDPAKVTIITRAARLRALAAGYLTSLRDAAQGADDPHNDVPCLGEILGWLNELET